MRKNKKAFTLIELIAVLVILAIIALIVTPLVMNIVKKAKDSANKRSVDAYGKAVELGVATYLLDNGDYPTDISSLTIEYSGSEVVCTTQKLNEDGSIYLSGCSVNGTEVKDSNTDDGWYHYGKISSPETTVYQTYNVGDTVTYNGIDFYVIEASDETKDSVTLLKEEPLTVDEVNTYGAGHVNRYASSSVGTANNNNGYGEMAYYSSETCGYVSNPYSPVTTGCTTDYSESEVKYVVDAWANDKMQTSDLKEDSLGYKFRLLTYDEFENLGYEWGERTPSDIGWTKTESTPLWVYNDNYAYWTMSASEDSTSNVWGVNNYGQVIPNLVSGGSMGANIYVVRPVITLSKDAI